MGVAAGPAALEVCPHAARSVGCNAVPAPVAFATDAWKLLAETRWDVDACWVWWTVERKGNRYEERSTAWLHCCTPNELVDLTGGAIGLGLCRYNSLDVHSPLQEREWSGVQAPSSSQPWWLQRCGGIAPSTQKLLNIRAQIENPTQGCGSNSGILQSCRRSTALLPLHLSIYVNRASKLQYPSITSF